MAPYGMSRSEIEQMIAEELGRKAHESGEPNSGPADEIIPRLLAHLIEGIALTIERNNALLAQQIIEAVRKDEQ
jgi:hypothetical protein